MKKNKKKITTFFGNVTCLELEHAVLIDFHVLFCLESMTQHHFVGNVFCNANVKYTSTFQCCYDQRLLFLSLLNQHAPTSTQWKCHLDQQFTSLSCPAVQKYKFKRHFKILNVQYVKVGMLSIFVPLNKYRQDYQNNR